MTSIVTYDTQDVRAVKEQNHPSLPDPWVVSSKASSLYAPRNPPEIMRGRAREQAHVTKWEGSDRVTAWLQTLPVSCRLEFVRRQVEPTTGSLLPAEERACASASACLLL